MRTSGSFISLFVSLKDNLWDEVVFYFMLKNFETLPKAHNQGLVYNI